MYHIEKNALDVSLIILTHSHWDHTADAIKLKEKTDASVALHKLDEYRVLEPMKHSIVPLYFELTPFKPDLYLEEGMKIQLGESNCLEVMPPGHTEGGISLVERSEKVILPRYSLQKQYRKI
jgi:glyoxylase-like metal-dependent hydrolase (beta-lactamase superfamily II)